LGTDLRELAAACQQLASDTTGTISVDVVARYYGGRVEATGFRVADAAAVGKAGEAVALLRHALATGSDPVPLLAALAAKLRTLVKVGAARGQGLDPVRDLGLASWQVDRARRELAGWTPESLAGAIAPGGTRCSRWSAPCSRSRGRRARAEPVGRDPGPQRRPASHGGCDMPRAAPHGSARGGRRDCDLWDGSGPRKE